MVMIVETRTGSQLRGAIVTQNFTEFNGSGRYLLLRAQHPRQSKQFNALHEDAAISSRDAP
jgi:hypothetical protein